METSIFIELDNDEFSEDLQGLVFILRGIANNIETGRLPSRPDNTQWLMDINGNRVGTWKLTNR